MRGISGFSLIELLLAIGTLALTLLLVLALGLTIMGRSRRSQDLPVGTIAAESVLNQLVYNVSADTVANRQLWFQSPTTAGWKTGSVTINQILFNYVVDFESLPVGGAALSDTNHLIKLTVRVEWFKGSGPNAGRQRSHLVRLVHQDA